MGIVTWIKVKALNNILNSVDIKEMADVIDAFGIKEFGKSSDKYIDAIQRTLVSLVVELGKRAKKEIK